MTTSYWNQDGKYQAKANEIQNLIPLEGSCADLKLETMRVIINLYYDWHNNGLGNTNRVQEFINNPTLTRELPELTQAIKNDLDFYQDEMTQYEEDFDNWEWDDENEDEPEEPMMIWSDEIESLLEQSLDHMIGQF
jgi:hypothetical protein